MKPARVLPFSLALSFYTLGCGCGEVETGPIWFEEVALSRGVDFQHVYATERDYWMPEAVGSGVAFLDIDNDGPVRHLLQGFLDDRAEFCIRD